MHRQRLRAHGTTDRTQTPKGFAKAHPIEYRIYNSMKNRCYNKKSQAYKNYGGRGITVDDRWLGPDGFVNFFNDMGERLVTNLSLDRIDVDGNYSKDNCRWTTITIQANNRRSNVFITYDGETKTIAEWAKEFKIGATTLYARIFKHKWPIEKALTKPVVGNAQLGDLAKKYGKERLLVYKRLQAGWTLEDALNRPIGYHRCKKIIEYKGVSKPITDWCKDFNIDYDTVVSRLKLGWSPEEIFTLEKNQYTPRKRRSQTMRSPL